MDPDTQIGGPDGRFPDTRHSAILGTRSGDLVQRNLSYESIVAAYWKPVYRYIRLKWRKSNEDAKDLTQSFFTAVIDKNFASRYDQTKGTFRTYLRTCLDRFLANQHVFEGRLKRSAVTVPLDHEIAQDDRLFERECTRRLFDDAVEQLREALASRGKQIYFELFDRYDLTEEHPTYEQLAEQFELPASAVTNYLAYARREFRSIVQERRRNALG